MKLQLFKNKKGLIYGTDSKRIACDIEGVLKIGGIDISIAAGVESIMPLLCNGCTGDYKATFTDTLGNVFDLRKVAVRAGRILPPDKIAVDLMELRCKIDALETKFDDLFAEINELKNIFDTNSLNFLIYEGDKK
jgi:hypothetical protein